MRKCEFEDALTEAEKACRRYVARLIGERVKVYRFANPGETECAVFDIGNFYQGDLGLARAKSYHWRAALDIYHRDHDELQRLAMRLIGALPVSEDNAALEDLRAESNVLVFRLAPESNAVSAIETANVEPARGGASVPCYTLRVLFDVVFAARFESN